MESMIVGRTFGTPNQSEQTDSASRKARAEDPAIGDSGFLDAMRKQSKLFAGRRGVREPSLEEQIGPGEFHKDRMSRLVNEDLILQGTLGSHGGSHSRVGNLNMHADRQMRLTHLSEIIELKSAQKETLEEELLEPQEDSVFGLSEEMADERALPNEAKTDALMYGNGFSLGEEKDVIRDRLASTKKVFDNLDAAARGGKEGPDKIETSGLDVQDAFSKPKTITGELAPKAKRQMGVEIDGRSFSENGLLKGIDTLLSPSASPASTTTAASRFMASVVHQLQADSSLFMTVYPEYARVSIELAKGEKIAIEMRMKDGCADVRAVGQAAGLLEGKTAELRAALEEAGMMLGEFSLESHDSEASFEDFDDDGSEFWDSSNHEAGAQEQTILEDQPLNHDNGAQQRRKQAEGRMHWVTA